MKQQEALEQIARHAKALKLRGAASLYLFGSVARGEATSDSDLDIFIDPVSDQKFSLIDLAGIKNFLEHELNIFVDVTTRKSLHPSLKATIEHEAIRAY